MFFINVKTVILDFSKLNNPFRMRLGTIPVSFVQLFLKKLDKSLAKKAVVLYTKKVLKGEFLKRDS